jgi:hypothetical protein
MLACVRSCMLPPAAEWAPCQGSRPASAGGAHACSMLLLPRLPRAGACPSQCCRCSRTAACRAAACPTSWGASSAWRSWTDDGDDDESGVSCVIRHAFAATIAPLPVSSFRSARRCGRLCSHVCAARTCRACLPLSLPPRLVGCRLTLVNTWCVASSFWRGACSGRHLVTNPTPHTHTHTRTHARDVCVWPII